jgi:uncharacterized DUF497 family protein
MDFEFDPAKSRSNRDKHGIDFEEAQALWKDDNLFELPVPSVEEIRLLAIGLIDDKYWTAVITYRSDRVRIISVRRARDVEIACYEG